MRKIAISAILLGVPLTVLVAGAAQARVQMTPDFPQGTISGRVRTVGGTALRGASVEVINTQTSEKRVIAAGEEGVFRISGLQLGKYRVVVRAPGFLAKPAVEVELAQGTGQELEVALKRQRPEEPIRAVIPF